MVATVAAGTAAQYYLAQVEYYLGGKEPDGRWMATASKLGVTNSSIVQRGDFERLHAALDTSGHSLIRNDGGRIKQVGGYDLTFSAPKSVSILWAMADPVLKAELEAVQAAAVEAAFELLNRETAYCRRGGGGGTLEKVKLIAASFQHGEARPAPHADGTIFADPALHTHVVVLNLAERKDGTFGRLDGRPFFSWKMAAGAVYHQALAAGLTRLGFGINAAGPNGIFEVAGITTETINYFSSRRKEIQKELAALDLQTAQAPALAAAKARATRRSKAPDGGRDRHEIWRERCANLGAEPERIVEQARTVGQEFSSDLISPYPKSAHTLLASLTERDSLFDQRQLIAALAAQRIGSNAIVPIEEELAQLRCDGMIVELGRDRWGHAIYSTPDVIRLEQSLYLRAARLARAKVRPPSTKRVEHFVATAGLNAEQEAAARHVCGSQAIASIEGAPGVGKTKLLQVTEVWKEEGWRAIGAATAWKVAHQLRDELGIEAKAIDSWLEGTKHGHPFLTDKTLLVIDESGLITSRQMECILAEVERARGAGLEVAVRMAGDRRQLQPIGGPGLSIVAEAIGTQRVDTIVRQRNSWARDIVVAFGDGRAAEALDNLRRHGCVHECDGPAATAATLVQHWDCWRRQHPTESYLLIAKTNSQVIALNRAARNSLRLAGALSVDDLVSLEAVTPSGRPYMLDLTEGDRIRFLLRQDALGIINGTEGRLQRIEVSPDGAIRLHARVDERDVVFAPADVTDENGRARLAHAYASTCYGSQGLTTEAAFVLTDLAMDRHDIHVAASRGQVTQLFVDQSALELRVKTELPLTERERNIEPHERIDALASALSRSGIKHKTLDYLTPTQWEALLDRSRQVAAEHDVDGAWKPSQATRHVNGRGARNSDQRTPAPDLSATTPNGPSPLPSRGGSRGLSLD